MNTATQPSPYPEGVEYRIPRPRGTWAGALLGSLLGLAVTETPAAAVAGGVIGGALANQPPPLEVAVRQLFAEKGLRIAGFYRPSPYIVRVIFGVDGHGWLIESRAPRHPDWTDELLEDWLYGDLTDQLRTRLNHIQSLLHQ